MDKQDTEKQNWLGSLRNKLRSSSEAETGVSAPKPSHHEAQDLFCNAFGFDLLAQLTEQEQQSVFFSPVSIALALNMVSQGADGETLTEITRTLHQQKMTSAEQDELCASLMALARDGDDKVKLSLANSLWVRHIEQIRPEFLAHTQRIFGAALYNLRGAPDTINQWCSEQTRGKITYIVGDEVKASDVVSVLVNAIYFYGKWTKPFDADNTREEMFTLRNGNQIPCRMMYRHGEYDYLENRDFQAVRIPYGKEDVSLLIFLPCKTVPFAAFLSSLTAENWRGWCDDLQSRKGSLHLPRFRCDYDVTLDSALKALGMPSAFDSNTADFSLMSDGFFIGLVKHKAFVEVDEQGTEAAAVTAILMRALSEKLVERIPPFEMIVDRPFFCAIVDEHTDTILFMGAITEP